MAAKKSARPTTNPAEPAIAKSDDGTIQITFTIPADKIKKAKEETAKEIAKEMEIPGFRKGKAPLDKVLAHIPQTSLREKSLSRILPKIISEIITNSKIKPAIVPRFELVSVEDNKDWQLRAITCEIPKINLGDYKKDIAGIVQVKQIWTPGKGSPKQGKGDGRDLSREEKEQEVMKALLNSIKVTVPKILIDEDANSRLSQLLERIEKLGLTLESYLSSLRKTPESLRKEYEEQSRQSIALDLILNEIANQEEIKVSEEQVEAAIKASGADPKLKERLDTPEQRRFIEEILRKRAALDSLIALI